MSKPTPPRIAALALLLTLAACLPTAIPMIGEAPEASPAGFLFGVWHGFMVLFSFIGSLFSDSIGVYEVRNTGWPYNLGYLLGIMMFFGGGGRGSRRRR